jgi:periplasmic protein CpxP/Spy
MRNTICTLALTGLLTLGMAGSAAMAQDQSAPQGEGQGRRGMNPEAQLKHLTQALDLTADQQTQIKPILESQHQQMLALRDNQSLSREDRMAKMKAIHEDSHTKIEAALNDTQKQKFEALQANMRDHRDGGPEAAPQ